ncbi:MAG: nuclear transport factor 2 family protein [Mesorhizobium sp.]|nr:nuclear transport factor 2 family protein [bacterium M00.F.Ca.ET.205.01.1.1]TGU53440.1 nuclear transport factor 2 family protein [bacterium M00.F.Ca.ET.152.01.1.1]TGV36948.1 nuclear transport factor 2 family protein [Mesorhizobium sp. M00.F.Ca.ET.186.01.1.1]TGZ41632.1 nuclear transport factor 2 family protein [bacterium M00.F.Ca.ET.162.01.1.1]TIW62704.1 MAG: nuclear transport factor 2 family protein [Mesorhizobium sp.]
MDALRHVTLAAGIALAPIDSGGAEPSGQAALADERAVIRIADAIDRAVDAQDWKLTRGYFADTVVADFSSLSGQPAATIPSDDLIGAWSANLKGSKTSLHLRTNHQVVLEANAATVLSNGYAWNRMEGNGDPLWEVWGTYEHHLTRSAAGWKVDGFTFRMTHERGNPWVKTTPGQ